MVGGGGSAPCAACKLLRRRCTKECIFAPYFSADEPHKFAYVHKVFGASNVSKMLQDVPLHQRGDAVSSMVYEANARMRDPVYGCVGAISFLQQQVQHLQKQLAVAQAENLCLRMHQVTSASSTTTDPAASTAELLPEFSPHHKSMLSNILEPLDTVDSLWTIC